MNIYFVIIIIFCGWFLFDIFAIRKFHFSSSVWLNTYSKKKQRNVYSIRIPLKLAKYWQMQFFMASSKRKFFFCLKANWDLRHSQEVLGCFNYIYHIFRFPWIYIYNILLNWHTKKTKKKLKCKFFVVSHSELKINFRLIGILAIFSHFPPCNYGRWLPFVHWIGYFANHHWCYGEENYI